MPPTAGAVSSTVESRQAQRKTSGNQKHLWSLVAYLCQFEFFSRRKNGKKPIAKVRHDRTKLQAGFEDT